MNSNKFKHLPHRPCVGIMLLNKDNQVFVGKRIDTKADAWQMPQGGIDDGESPIDAAFRELLEETGVSSASIIKESSLWYEYNLPDELIPKLWGGKYRGQKQKWFAMRFEGSDEEINIASKIPEFSHWQWVAMKELPNLIVEFKRQLYTDIVAEFETV